MTQDQRRKPYDHQLAALLNAIDRYVTARVEADTDSGDPGSYWLDADADNKLCELGDRLLELAPSPPTKPDDATKPENPNG